MMNGNPKRERGTQPRINPSLTHRVTIASRQCRTTLWTTSTVEPPNPFAQSVDFRDLDDKNYATESTEPSEKPFRFKNNSVASVLSVAYFVVLN